MGIRACRKPPPKRIDINLYSVACNYAGRNEKTQQTGMHPVCPPALFSPDPHFATHGSNRYIHTLSLHSVWPGRSRVAGFFEFRLITRCKRGPWTIYVAGSVEWGCRTGPVQVRAAIMQRFRPRRPRNVPGTRCGGSTLSTRRP